MTTFEPMPGETEADAIQRYLRAAHGLLETKLDTPDLDACSQRMAAGLAIAVADHLAVKNARRKPSAMGDFQGLVMQLPTLARFVLPGPQVPDPGRR